MILFHRLKTNVWWLKKAGFWCVSFELEEQSFVFFLSYINVFTKKNCLSFSACSQNTCFLYSHQI